MTHVATAGAGAGALVLAVSAVLKLVDPEATRELLAALGLGPARVATAVLAVAELAIAVAALAAGGVAYGALALANLGFAVVLVLARRRAPGLSCGCFGRRSGPPDPAQVAADLVVAAVALSALGLGAPGLAGAIEDAPVRGLVTAAASVALAGLYAALATRRRSTPAVGPT